jgi:hypothetical protein
MKPVAHPSDPSWVDAVVRSFVTTPSAGGRLDAHDRYADEVLDGTPSAQRTLLLDAMLRAFPEIND